MCLTRPPPALLPVLLVLGALGAHVPLATAATTWRVPPLPSPTPPPISIEVLPEAQSCGGLWAQDCGGGSLRCVDDPSDACDPRWDWDCPGLCVESGFVPAPDACWLPEPTRRYVTHEPPLCTLLLLSCAAEEQAFSDACGCGCEQTH